MRTEAGFTLVEMLLAISLLTAVLLATVRAMQGYGGATQRTIAQSESQGIARSTIDRLARELRNAAGPGQGGTVIERAEANELVFIMVNPLSAGSGSNSTSEQRVRYCLNPTPDQIYRQVQSWDTATRPSLPSPAPCPHQNYGTQELVAEDVVNSSDQPLLSYDSTSAASITSVTLDVRTDVDVGRPPNAQRLTTTINLRNQNRAPTAIFTADVIGTRHVLLNASTSSDPDSEDLTYQWYDGSTPIGQGPLLDYASPTGGNHSFSLQVTDTGGLSATAPAQTVNLG